MKRIFVTAAAALLLAACQKEKPAVPTLEVSTIKSTFKVNEIVNFTLNGNPGYITFYSGLPGARYENNKRLTAAGTPTLQFTSAKTSGTQTNTLQLLVSSDFAGVGVDSATTVSNIAKANWTDISNRAVLSTGSAVASGAVNLSDFPTDKPLFFAFKYTAAAGSIQPKWTISALTVTNTLPDQSVYTLANLTATSITNYGVNTLTSPGWVGYKVANNFNWVISSGSSLVITGATTAALATAPAEAWTFCGSVVLNKVSNDIGTPIKETSMRLEEYPFIYQEPGKYHVTFVAGNKSMYGQEEVVKELEIVVAN